MVWASVGFCRLMGLSFDDGRLSEAEVSHLGDGGLAAGGALPGTHVGVGAAPASLAAAAGGPGGPPPRALQRPAGRCALSAATAAACSTRQPTSEPLLCRPLIKPFAGRALASVQPQRLLPARAGSKRLWHAWSCVCRAAIL